MARNADNSQRKRRLVTMADAPVAPSAPCLKEQARLCKEDHGHARPQNARAAESPQERGQQQQPANGNLNGLAAAPRHIIGRTGGVHEMRPVHGGHAAALRRTHDAHVGQGNRHARDMVLKEQRQRQPPPNQSPPNHPRAADAKGDQLPPVSNRTRAKAGENTTVCSNCGRRKKTGTPICMHCAADSSGGKTRASINRLAFVMKGCPLTKSADNRGRQITLGPWIEKAPRKLLVPLGSLDYDHPWNKGPNKGGISRGDMNHTVWDECYQPPMGHYRASKVPPKVPESIPPLERSKNTATPANGKSRYHYPRKPRPRKHYY